MTSLRVEDLDYNNHVIEEEIESPALKLLNYAVKKSNAKFIKRKNREMDMLGAITDIGKPKRMKSHRRRGSDASAAEWNRREVKYKE